MPVPLLLIYAGRPVMWDHRPYITATMNGWRGNNDKPTSAHVRAGRAMSDDDIITVTVPAKYAGEPDATLSVELEDDGESYKMTLTHADGHVIASAGDFRPGAGYDFGSDSHRAAMTAGTFGAFLAHALEDPEWGESAWDVIADDAGEWTVSTATVFTAEEFDNGNGNLPIGDPDARCQEAEEES